MNRYLLSAEAMRDLSEIKAYLDRVPSSPAHEIARAIQHALRAIGQDPYLGIRNVSLSAVSKQEIRSRLVASYRVFYRIQKGAPEIIDILHTARDIERIMQSRVQ